MHAFTLLAVIRLARVHSSWMWKVRGLVYYRSPLNVGGNVVGADRVAKERAVVDVVRTGRGRRSGCFVLRGMKGSKATATQGAAPGITPQLVTQGRVWDISTSDVDRLGRGPVRCACDGRVSRHAERCLSDAAAYPPSYREELDELGKA
jgi:hypothetical protein